MKKYSILALFFCSWAHAELSNSGLYDANGNPVVLGQTSMSASLPIAISSNQSALPVSQSGAWSVTSSGSSTVTQGTSPWVNNITQFGSSNVVTGTGISGAGIPRVTVANDSNVLATQSGAWTTGRTWTLLNTTDSVNAVQSGAWTTGRTWTLSSGTDSIAAVQSGTWTVQQGSTPTAVANAWPIKLTDGTNTTAVKAASTAALASDPSAVVALSPNSPLPTGSNSIGTVGLNAGANLIGSVNQGTSPWVSNVTQFGSSNVVTGTGTGGSGIPRVTVSNDSNILATQSGTWTTGRTWTLASGTDSVAAVQSTASNLNAQVVGNVASAASDSGNPVKVGGVYNTSTPTYTNAQRADLQFNLHGLPLTDSSITDITGTVTSTANGSAIDAGGYGSIAFTVNVSAASGTTPTLDLILQQSDDGTNDWTDEYSVERFTTTGSYKTVRMSLHARYYRYRYVISGTTPSFTFTVRTTLKAPSASVVHVYNKYNDLVMTSSNNFSSTVNVEGCSFWSAALTRGAGGAGVTIVAQYSNDATNWINSSGSNINTSASNSFLATNVAGSTTRYVRFTNTSNQAAATTMDIKYYCKE